MCEAVLSDFSRALSVIRHVNTVPNTASDIEGLILLEKHINDWEDARFFQNYVTLLSDSVGLLVQNELLLHNYSVGIFWTRISSIIEKILDYVTYQGRSRFTDLFCIRTLLFISHVFSLRKPYMDDEIIEDCYLTASEILDGRPKEMETHSDWNEISEIYENIENTYYLRHTYMKQFRSVDRNKKKAPNVDEPNKNFPTLNVPNFGEKSNRDNKETSNHEEVEHKMTLEACRESTMKSSVPEIKVVEDISIDMKREELTENQDKESSNDEIEATTNDAINDFEYYIDDLCLRIVKEANLEASSKLKAKQEVEDREKHAKKFVIHSFSIPYRPSTQPTTFGPVLLPPKKHEQEIPVIVKKSDSEVNANDEEIMDKLTPLPPFSRPNFNRF